MTHPSSNKKSSVAVSTNLSWPAHTPVMGDSLEVMEAYHSEQVQVLERTLQRLNLLDNAREIAFLCREVISVKEALNKIVLKKKFLA